MTRQWFIAVWLNHRVGRRYTALVNRTVKEKKKKKERVEKERKDYLAPWPRSVRLSCHISALHVSVLPCVIEHNTCSRSFFFTLNKLSALRAHAHKHTSPFLSFFLSLTTFVLNPWPRVSLTGSQVRLLLKLPVLLLLCGQWYNNCESLFFHYLNTVYPRGDRPGAKYTAAHTYDHVKKKKVYHVIKRCCPHNEYNHRAV